MKARCSFPSSTADCSARRGNRKAALVCPGRSRSENSAESPYASRWRRASQRAKSSSAMPARNSRRFADTFPHSMSTTAKNSGGSTPCLAIRRKAFENKAMEAAAKTWAGEWWKQGGGGSMWDGMAYDPDENLLYVGTGNGSAVASGRSSGTKARRISTISTSPRSSRSTQTPAS